MLVVSVRHLLLRWPLNCSKAGQSIQGRIERTNGRCNGRNSITKLVVLQSSASDEDSAMVTCVGQSLRHRATLALSRISVVCTTRNSADFPVGCVLLI